MVFYRNPSKPYNIDELVKETLEVARLLEPTRIEQKPDLAESLKRFCLALSNSAAAMEREITEPHGAPETFVLVCDS
jgi:hypothetical protein